MKELPSLKKLPLGRQTFSKLINGDCVYADKTRYIYNLISEDAPYFLSRP
ncbi:MAG: AAA family ATPase, partial [Deltaproteobacteria bacterium]|nr:AAA family ATPase [Deltaproteobacteria bacterium]